MINPHELRIGNLVKPGPEHMPPFDVEKYCEVTQVYKDGFTVDYHYPGDWFDPIPLTPEWLEKCGFAYGPFVYADGSTGDGFIKGMFKISELQISNEFDGYGAEYFPYSQSHNCLPGNMKYLHELQNNYFCWTGKELEIKL